VIVVLNFLFLRNDCLVRHCFVDVHFVTQYWYCNFTDQGQIIGIYSFNTLGKILLQYISVIGIIFQFVVFDLEG